MGPHLALKNKIAFQKAVTGKNDWDSPLAGFIGRASA
jgi:hypothetical protein